MQSQDTGKGSKSLAGAAWLVSAPTQAVLNCLTNTGHGARIVGGAVRNAILGHPVSDIDIATSATPDQAIAAAAAAGFKTIATGIKHGTVTVVVQGVPFEVTTLRRDVETDGRHATVAFTQDWAADAARRDLTLNALYCDASGQIFDPLGGLDDLLARRVRFIGDARARIREDYLRILRFFRFTAEYADGSPDATGMEASVAEREGLQKLSAERVRSEIVRLLVAPRCIETIDAMASHGLLTAVIPASPRLGVLRRLVAVEAATQHAPNAPLRLAALSVAVAEDAQRLGQHLRLAGAERDVLLRAASQQCLAPSLTGNAQRGALYRLGETQYIEAVLLAWALGTAPPDDAMWHELIQLPQRWQIPAMPFSGRDLLERGLTPGPKVGEILGQFEAWWVANDFPAGRSVIEAQLDYLLRHN